MLGFQRVPGAGSDAVAREASYYARGVEAHQTVLGGTTPRPQGTFVPRG
jgi:hypothetical protein